MARYYLPNGMRYSTLEEREQFYTQEFNLKRLRDWLALTRGEVTFAIVIGRHTKIYPKKYAEDASTTIIVDDYESLEDLRDYLMEFLPEAAYYDRNVYNGDNHVKGQELAFDLDPENVTCPIHGTLEDKMKRHQGLSFCKLELEQVREQAVSLYDPEAYVLSAKERAQIAEDVKGKGFQIDEWVTAGEMRLIRLPFTLHGLVSRIVIPLEKKELERFDPIYDKRCLPKFLSDGVIS